jgi:hypothetical protein
MKTSRPASTIQSSSSSYYIVIMILVFALLATTSLELDNASGEEEKDIGVNDSAANSDNKTSVQELGDPPCKSPCPPNAEMCIQMCA